MKFKEKKPPRKFQVGADKEIEISDCGEIFLAPNEQVTFLSQTNKKYDWTAKEWGFYVTPSMNARLRNEGFKVALVKNMDGRFYVMAVDQDRIPEFKQYIKSEECQMVEWLDELS